MKDHFYFFDGKKDQMRKDAIKKIIRWWRVVRKKLKKKEKVKEKVVEVE